MSAAPFVVNVADPSHAEHGASSPECCASCAAPIGTPYCPRCGEQRASDRHYSLLHFGEEVLEAFTHADGRLARTLRTLVTRPGELTLAYMAGRRRLYLAPLQLFLILNVVFLLAGESRWGIHTFDTPLSVQLGGQPYSSAVRPLVLARVAARHTILAAYAERFDHTATAAAHSLLIVLVPLVAIAAAIVTLPRISFAVRHVVFALHALAAMMLLLLAGWTTSMLLALIALGAGVHLQISDAAFSGFLAIILGAYLARALMVVYDEGRVSATIRAVLLTLSLLPIITLYRFILFYVTFYTT